jgi:hypothetical protein
MRFLLYKNAAWITKLHKQNNAQCALSFPSQIFFCRTTATIAANSCPKKLLTRNIAADTALTTCCDAGNQSDCFFYWIRQCQVFQKCINPRKNIYVRAGALLLVILAIAAAVIYKPVVPENMNPVVQSQDISEVTATCREQGKRLEYLLLADPLSDFPRYVFKYKDAAQIHVVKVPSTSHVNLEREILLKNAIPYSIATDEFLNTYKAALQDGNAKNGWLSDVGVFFARNAIGLALLIFLIVVMKKRHPRHGIEHIGDQAREFEGQHG